MSWLLKIASKADYLFSKYRKLARARWQQHFEETKHSGDWATNLIRTTQAQGRSIEDGINSTADRQLKQQIQHAIEVMPKYADWYVGRIINENWSNAKSMFHPGPLGGNQLRYLLDYLDRGHGQIPSLNTTTAEAYALSEAWHKKMREQEHQYKSDDIVAQLSGGFKLVKVPKEDAKAEGYHMGHCVGSYCEDIEQGKSIIFSIRDAKNEPHVTFEVQPTKFSDPQKGDYWVITQIQGKENKPQPKYGDQVSEAIEAIMGKYPITISGEGLSDFYGFQTNFDRRMETLSRIADDDAEHDEIFDLHHFARHGGIPQDPLWDWMEENIDQLTGDYPIDDADFFPYLMGTSRNDLLEHLDMWQSDVVTEDEDEAEDDPDLMTEGEFNSFYNSVERGKADAYSIPEALESQVYDWIENQKQYDEEAVKEYFWDNYEDTIKSGYLRDLSDRIEFDDLEVEYDQWERYYKKKQEEELQQHATQLVMNAIEENNIQIPDVKGRGITGSIEPVVTIPRIVWKMNPQKHWLTMNRVSPEGVQQAIDMLLAENQSRVDKEQVKDRDFARWIADYSTPVPELQQLPDYDQWYFYNVYGHLPPNRQWVETMRQQIGQRLSRRAPQQPATTNLTPGQGLSHTEEVAAPVVEHQPRLQGIRPQV